ncbi:MAG: serine hydrolase [Chlorobia bacterium]|nr:serine hydrolase [Fimbriimonadaceae bacterium]
MLTLAVVAIMKSDILLPVLKLDSLASTVHVVTLKEFPKMTADQLGIAIGKIDRKADRVDFGQFQGKSAFYPASTVKLFYLAYGAKLLDSGKLKMTEELERGFKDMIVDSTNDATALILDAITDTTGGPELAPNELKKWTEKRNAVNSWLTDLGFSGINVNQKTWNEGPYGRERQGYGPKFEYRNSLTPEAGVRMMSLIAMDKLVSKQRHEWMKGYLSRRIPVDSKEADSQSQEFVGSALATGSKLWSKAGYTSTVRMDIAWTQLQNGNEYVFAIFTKGHSNEPRLIPFVARKLLGGLGEQSTVEKLPVKERTTTLSPAPIS